MDISIIIPTYNRKNDLKRCLESIFAQNYPKNAFEVIVVDDGSSDETENLLKEFTKQYLNLRYFRQKNKGPAAARNLGVDKSVGEIIGFIDDDCAIDGEWIRLMVESHRLDDQAAVVGGLTLVANEKTTVLVSQFLSNCSIESDISGARQVIFFPTCNVSFKRKVLTDHKFDEKFPLPGGEDLEFFWRLFNEGYKLVWNKKIIVIHFRCHSTINFIRQAFIYGRGNLLVQYIHKNHPLLKEIKVANPILFIFGTLINFIKIFRFAGLLGRRLIDCHDLLLGLEKKNFSFYEKSKIYIYLVLHKVVYLMGNIAEYLRIEIRLKRNRLECSQRNLTKPQFIILDVTHRCNLKCNICEIRKDEQIKEFTTDEIKNIINQAIGWGVGEFVLSGGEPLLRDDIFEILKFVHSKKYHVGILSNGIVLNDSLIDKLLPYLISGTVSLSISLDALSSDIHDEIRGMKGAFGRTRYCLERLAQLKHSNPGINFNTISVILNENLEELLNMAKFFKSLNVNSMQFQPLLVNNLLMNDRLMKTKYWVSQDRLMVLDKVINELVEFKRDNPSIFRNSENNLLLIKKYFQGNLTDADIKCFHGDKTILIANSGDVTTCFECYGNIRDVTLENIYYSYKAGKAREKVKSCKRPCLLPCFTDY